MARAWEAALEDWRGRGGATGSLAAWESDTWESGVQQIEDQDMALSVSGTTGTPERVLPRSMPRPSSNSLLRLPLSLGCSDTG